MELRDIEIFLALAEELHFGRTAERLHITPSRVSHVIKKQERRIGAPLFERTSRTVRLTPVGERLYQTLQPAYQRIIDGGAEVSATLGDVRGTLTLGSMGPQGWMINDIVDRFRTRHPAVEFVHRDLNSVDPLTPLRSGEIDVAHLWLPVREPDITVGPVTHTSPIMLAMAATHPFATRDSVCLEDYGELTFVAPYQSLIPPYMEETFQPFRTPSDRSRPGGHQLGRPAQSSQRRTRRRRLPRRGPPLLPVAQRGLCPRTRRPALSMGLRLAYWHHQSPDTRLRRCR